MVQGFFWVLLEALGIFGGLDFWLHSIIPITWNPEYPCGGIGREKADILTNTWWIVDRYTIDCIYPLTHSHKTCFHVTSNVWVLLLDTAQREDDSNQQERKKLSERHPTFNNLWNQVKDLVQDYFFSEVGRRLGCSFKTRYALHFTFGHENLKVWHLKLRHLMSCENMFCTGAFTGRCNWRYWPCISWCIDVSVS